MCFIPQVSQDKRRDSTPVEVISPSQNLLLWKQVFVGPTVRKQVSQSMVDIRISTRQGSSFIHPAQLQLFLHFSLLQPEAEQVRGEVHRQEELRGLGKSTKTVRLKQYWY
jgi:hypothetical protein